MANSRRRRQPTAKRTQAHIHNAHFQRPASHSQSLSTSDHSNPVRTFLLSPGSAAALPTFSMHFAQCAPLSQRSQTLQSMSCTCLSQHHQPHRSRLLYQLASQQLNPCERFATDADPCNVGCSFLSQLHQSLSTGVLLLRNFCFKKPATRHLFESSASACQHLESLGPAVTISSPSRVGC